MDESISTSDAERVAPVVVDQRVVYTTTPGKRPSTTYVVSSST
jgi:hypothetical protein